jgi:hypothetical protein
MRQDEVEAELTGCYCSMPLRAFVDAARNGTTEHSAIGSCVRCAFCVRFDITSCHTMLGTAMSKPLFTSLV